MTATPFSVLIRSATHEQHTRAQESSFIGELMDGRLELAAYARYTEQLYFVYAALEAAGAGLAGDPVAGPFLRPELTRLPELERDLDHLCGPGWREGAEPLPATRAYAERIARVGADWPGGFVAHHYTRYLGDLSGGQIIRDVAERTWGFARKGDGVRFYVFDRIANPAEFKRSYREALDAFGGDELERTRVVEECRRAFALNNAVFTDLGRHFRVCA